MTRATRTKPVAPAKPAAKKLIEFFLLFIGEEWLDFLLFFAPHFSARAPESARSVRLCPVAPVLTSKYREFFFLARDLQNLHVARYPQTGENVYVESTRSQSVLRKSAHAMECRP
ncbi:MAG: hypothetical protein ACLR17_22305 [Enterobacteriaceae bacterium]